MAADETLLNRGSRLCIACGLCCDGALHDAAALLPEEIPLALGLGMKVTEVGSDVRFALPCHLLKDRCCTVYADRPSPCRNYKCKLLLSLEADEASLEDCLDKVRTARNLLRDLEQLLPLGMTIPEARASAASTLAEEGASTTVETRLAKANIKLQAFTLNVYLDRYFRNAHEGKYLRSSSTIEDGD